ncbi:uncharacterized protein [Nicotiana sylvestris]|uniref:uncharacterized protein n=1 Tax=Nicotiana sylvestris TaxID=4096 RepID=UPI00388C8B10
MAQSDNDEVNFRDVQRNLKSYSPKKLMSLANMLNDAYHNLVDDKDALTVELGDVEQTRDDLVICVVDLKETISNLENEKVVLTENIASIEHERDDLVVVVVDLKETIENFSKEKDALVEKICDKGNKVEFLSKICTVTNLVTGEVVLVAKRYKNIYIADFESLQSGDLSWLKALDDDAQLWHGRMGHASFSLRNRLVQKDLVRGLPMTKFKENNVRDACARGKHVKSLYKPKKDVSTSKPLDLLHMDLCDPMRVQSRGGKRYIFVIVDDYSRFT